MSNTSAPSGPAFRVDFFVAFVTAALAGVTAWASAGLRPVGVVLIAVAGSLLGWSTAHVITSPRHRSAALGVTLIGLTAGAFGVVAFPLPHSRHQQVLPHFIDPDRIVVAPSVDPERPYAVSQGNPAQHGYPYAKVMPAQIANRGHPVPIELYGTGFSSYSLVTIAMFRPDGGGPAHNTSVYAQENGAWATRMLWAPAAAIGASRNNGSWRIDVTDRYSGQTTSVQVNVTSDGHTPDPSDWSDRDAYERQLSPSGLRLLVGTEGSMCTRHRAVSVVTVKGSTPDEAVKIVYLNPANEEIAEEGTTADDFGEVSAKPLFWDTSNCSRGVKFEYTVIAIDPVSGGQAKGVLFLSTPAQ